MDEITPVGLTPTPYSARLETEELVLRAAGRGVRSVVLRPPVVYGRGRGQILSVLVDIAEAAGTSRYVRGTGDHMRSFAHVDDLADLYVLIPEKATGGELFYAAAVDNFNVRYFHARVGRWRSHGRNWERSEESAKW